MSSPPLETPTEKTVPVDKNIITDKGTFTLGPVIGKGGFGTVYQGLDVAGGTFVAIKQLKLSAVPKDQLGGIMAEIELLRSLDHPNIVRYITYLATSDSLSIIMEYVENGSLLRIMKKFGKFPETLVAIYISQVLEGLVFLHEQGVIHRDIKGANILVTKTGAVKIADFGIASKLNEQDNLDVMGTPYWMAPEIIELNGATTKSDIWSVACTVIELLNGQPPYFELAAMPALFRIVQDEHPPLPEGISNNCKDWMLCAFKKDPEQRPSALKLFNHKWLKDARATQAASKRTLGLEDAKKMVDDAEASREKRKATRNRANTHDNIEAGGIPISPQPSQKKAAADLVAELSLGQEQNEENGFDLEGLDIGPMDTNATNHGSTQHQPQMNLPSAVGKSASGPTESLDDDFGGDFGELQLQPVGKQQQQQQQQQRLIVPSPPKHPAPNPTAKPNQTNNNRTASASVPISIPRTPTKSNQQEQTSSNWSDEFDLPAGSLKLKVSPYNGTIPQTTPTKKPQQPTQTNQTQTSQNQQRPLPQVPQKKAVTTDSGDDSNWSDQFACPVGSLKLQVSPARQTSCGLNVREPPNTDQKKVSPKSPRSPLIRHNTTQVTKPEGTTTPVSTAIKPVTRPHALSIASKEESNNSSLNDSHKTSTTKLSDVLQQQVNTNNTTTTTSSSSSSSSPMKNPVARSQLLATLEAASKDPAPRQDGDDDTWADFDFAALNGKKEDGGELHLQLRTALNSSNGRTSNASMERSEGGDEPEWGDDEDSFSDEDKAEDQRELREEQAALQTEATNVFSVISKTGAKEDEIISALSKLTTALREHSVVKGRAVQQTGAAALADLLERSHTKPTIIIAALRTVNELIDNCPEAQLLFGVAGGVSVVLGFSAPVQSLEVRTEVAKFITLVSAGQPLETLVSCRGPNALVQLLLGSKPELAALALSGISIALGLQNGRACGDVGRAFVRVGLLPALIATARNNIKEETICTSVGVVFLTLIGANAAGACSSAGADVTVREALCTGEVLKGILELVAKAPEQLRVALLKTIKLAASDPANIEALYKAGAIKTLMEQLPRESANAAARYNTLVALSQLCKLNPERQSEAARLGIIPHLLAAADSRALKDVAIPMLCDLLRVKASREEMWKNNCLMFFINLLRDRIYQPNALESIAWWLLDEPSRVKAILGHSKQIHKLGKAFEKSENVVWPRLVGPFLRIVSKSRAISRKMGKENTFVMSLLQKLASPQAKADVKKEMLRMLARLVAVHRERHAFITQYELVSRLTLLRRENQSTLILVTLIDDMLSNISK